MIGMSYQRTGFAGFGMCICNKRTEHLSNLLFDGFIKSATCKPVSIDDLFFSERRFEMLINANNFFSKLVKIRFKFCHFSERFKITVQKYPFPSDKSRIKSVFVTSIFTYVSTSVTKSHF